MSQYVIIDGIKHFQFEDGSTAQVVAPLAQDGGSAVSLAPQQFAILGNIETLLAEGNASTATPWEVLQSTGDLVQSFTYLDPGTVDERVSTVTYSSVSASLSMVETYTYGGVAGAYRLLSIVRSNA